MGSTELFVGALFTPPFFVAQIVKGNDGRRRGDGLLTQWTRSHQHWFFEVTHRVNTETALIHEVTWWSTFSAHQARLSISTKSQS